MKLMISLKPHRYAGRLLKRGDVFRVRGVSDERLLVALGRAEHHIEAEPIAAIFAPEPVEPAVEPVTEPVVEQVEDAEQPAESPEPEAEISLRTGKPKRQYKRRDMTAED